MTVPFYCLFLLNFQGSTHLFGVGSFSYLIIPRTTSQRRRYIPVGFMNGQNIGSDALMVIFNADLFMFGVLISNVHAAWLRTVGGRLKSDYRYSAVIVYNSFPWPNPTVEQKEKIENTAQAILDADRKSTRLNSSHP